MQAGHASRMSKSRTNYEQSVNRGGLQELQVGPMSKG
jgi:hypothetical protein